MADPNQPSSSSRNIHDSRAGTEVKRAIEEAVEYFKLVRDAFGSRKDSRYDGFFRVRKDYKKGDDSRAGTKEKRAKEEAVEYVNLVRDTFGSDSRYDGFLRVFEDYKKGEIDIPKVISLVKLMFEGHHELLKRFNDFLPCGYSIDSVVPENDTHKKEDAVEAFPPVIDLLKKIKTCTQDGKEYRSFLNAILKFREDRNMNVFKELPIIFKDYPDLLEEFYILFPDARGEVPEKCVEGQETGQKSLI